MFILFFFNLNFIFYAPTKKKQELNYYTEVVIKMCLLEKLQTYFFSWIFKSFMPVYLNRVLFAD